MPMLYSVHVDAERWRQIEELYHAAGERAPGDRAAFLDGACTDPGLRREIEELLESSGDQGILGRPAPFSEQGDTSGAGDNPSGFGLSRIAPGQPIYQYRVLEKIGRGGMGEVFLAEDTILKRRVALKFLRMAESEMAGRGILAEARAAAALNHPQVCKIFTTGEFDGRPFIVMEFVEGETLQQRLTAGSIPLGEALPILIGIAEALGEAHEKNMVHCDIKPGNVMIMRGGHIKLMDFGLARRIPRTVLGPEDPTETSRVQHAAGTLAYMAPEQARGEQLDARADVFALGVVFFEMLTGVHPFRRKTPEATIGAILYEDPPAIRQYLPAAAPLLTGIFGRMLAKAPAARYESAVALAADLISLRDLRNKQSSLPALPTIAILPFQDLSPQHDQDYFCDGLAEELITALGAIEQLRVVSRSAAFQYRNATIGLHEIGKALRATLILEGSVRKAGERLRITLNLVDPENGFPVWSERYDRRLDDIFEVQDDISRSVSEKMQLTFKSGSELHTDAGTKLVHAYELYLKGRHLWNKRTAENLRLSIEQFEKAIGEDPQYARAWAGLGDAWVTLCIYGAAKPADAIPVAKHAVKRALALMPELPEALLSLACIRAIFDWDWKGSEEDFEKAIQLNPRSAQARQWFAMNCLAPCRRFDRAERELRLAAELEPESPAIATSLAVLDFFRTDYDAAIRRLSAVLELNPSFYLAHYFLGQAYSEKGMHADAVRQLESAVALAKGSVESLAALGYAQAAAGQRAESMDVLNQLLHKEKERNTWVSPVSVAQVQLGLGLVDAAVASIERGQDARATDLIWLAVRPAFARIREDSRAIRVMAATGTNSSESLQ